MREAVRYIYRGQVERVRKGGRFIWYDGYSADGAVGLATYPWMTKTECRADARRQNKRAFFFGRDGKEET